MAKQIEDIIPNDKRSIRNIPIPENRRKNINLINNNQEANIPSAEPYIPSNSQANPNMVQDIYKEPMKQLDNIPVRNFNDPVVPRIDVSSENNFRNIHSSKRKLKKPMAITALVVVVALGLGIFSLFNGATIKYKPKTAALTFNGDIYTAYKDGKPGDLLFSVIKFSEEQSLEAPASGEEQASTKASGQIIVYNNSGTASQRLIKNTRFETPDGKVFRIQNDINVPGKTADQPGSLEVTVYADQPGDSYNIGLSDFTLPGLKGDPKFTTIYARSKTPMTGGFVGTIKKVSNEDKNNAKKKIEEDLKNILMEEAKAQVPSDFFLLPNLTEITFEEMPAGTTTSDMAQVREKGNFSGIIFKKADLVRYLASKKTTVGATENVDADLLSLNISTDDITSGISNVDKVTLNITGTSQLMWVVDEEDIKAQVKGKNKNALQSILANYPSIVEANGVVRPFWKTSFPDDTSKIKMVNELK